MSWRNRRDRHKRSRRTEVATEVLSEGAELIASGLIGVLMRGAGLAVRGVVKIIDGF